jgi:hypothetical protein
MIDKEQILRAIRERSLREAAHLAGEFARAAAEEREEILAALEGEKWLAQSCLEALAPSDCLETGS